MSGTSNAVGGGASAEAERLGEPVAFLGVRMGIERDAVIGRRRHLFDDQRGRIGQGSRCIDRQK